MNCLSPHEVSSWIRKAGQIENPDDAEVAPAHQIGFSAPENYNYLANECFAECFIDQIVGKGDLLLVVTDSEPPMAWQGFVIDAVRRSIGEHRSAEEAPGYFIPFGEREKAIALFALMSCFSWKCYLYASHDQMTLFNWEGEIFHFWTSSELKKNEMLEVIRNFGLKEIAEPSP